MNINFLDGKKCFTRCFDCCEVCQRQADNEGITKAELRKKIVW